MKKMIIFVLAFCFISLLNVEAYTADDWSGYAIDVYDLDMEKGVIQLEDGAALTRITQEEFMQRLCVKKNVSLEEGYNIKSQNIECQIIKMGKCAHLCCSMLFRIFNV